MEHSLHLWQLYLRKLHLDVDCRDFGGNNTDYHFLFWCLYIWNANWLIICCKVRDQEAWMWLSGVWCKYFEKDLPALEPKFISINFYKLYLCFISSVVKIKLKVNTPILKLNIRLETNFTSKIPAWNNPVQMNHWGKYISPRVRYPDNFVPYNNGQK